MPDLYHYHRHKLVVEGARLLPRALPHPVPRSAPVNFSHPGGLGFAPIPLSTPSPYVSSPGPAAPTSQMFSTGSTPTDRNISTPPGVATER